MDKLNVKVIKRDGRTVNFDKSKIFYALKKASEGIDDNVINELSDKVTNEISNRFKEDVKIYEIQNIVEHELIENGYDGLAKNYINYRLEHDLKRKNSSDVNKAVDMLLSRDKSVINENANKDSDVFNTFRDLTAGAVAKAVGFKMLDEHIVNAHQKGEIHFHDLDYSPYTTMPNCCLIDFKDMFENGFKLGNAQVDSPKSIQTATAQASQIIANVASSQYGGCTFDRADEVLAPYAELNFNKHLNEAKKWINGSQKQIEYATTKTNKDIYDAMQSLEYEINTLFTSNGQTPFVSLGFGLGTNSFEREIQKAILQVRLKGLGKEGRTAIFPKLIFTLKRDVNLNEGTPNYDIKQLALKCSSKRMYPDVLSYDKIVELTGSFKSSMGCRSFLQGWQDDKGKEVTSGRNNLGVVTLNLVRIAIEANGDVDKFYKLLDDRLKICKDALLFRIKRVREASPKNAPILFMNGALGRLSSSDKVEDLYNNERSTVSLGYIGLYEVGTLFFNPNWEQNKEAKEFTLNILKYMNNECKKWTKEYGYYFSLYGTPSESLTDRFCKLDKEKFGSIKHITSKDYYTNSFHYDVRKNPTPFEKLDFEKDFPVHASGGFIHYCEYPIIDNNLKALESVWDFAYDRVGYLGTNVPIDKCFKCNYSGEFEPTAQGFKCPDCGNTDPLSCEVVKRTCGYLGNPQARPMVYGRHQEISNRVKHIDGVIGKTIDGREIKND